MATIQAQQEAFAKKGQKTEEDIPQVTRGNVAAERLASIRAQQEAFAKKGQKTVQESEESKEGVTATAKMFGDSVKSKSMVQKRMEELERKQKEEAMKNDPTSYQKVSWRAGEGYGQFKKQMKDSRGVAEKKSLSDLP